MRDLMPLPGVTPAQVVSQLAYRLFGPMQPRRIQMVLDYHGLLAQSAGSTADIARRHHVTARTVTNNVTAIRAAGARQPLSPVLVVETERASSPQDDHLGRVRIAATLGLIAPEPPAAVDLPLAKDDGTVVAAQLTIARAAERILTAVGPLTLPVLTTALARGRRFRDRNQVSASDLATALGVVSCTVDNDGRWHSPTGNVPSERDQLIVAGASGRELTRNQMIHILIDAGYSKSSAEGRMSSSHPLFQHTDRDRYRLITDKAIDNRHG